MLPRRTFRCASVRSSRPPSNCIQNQKFTSGVLRTRSVATMSMAATHTGSVRVRVPLSLAPQFTRSHARDRISGGSHELFERIGDGSRPYVGEIAPRAHERGGVGSAHRRAEGVAPVRSAGGHSRPCVGVPSVGCNRCISPLGVVVNLTQLGSSAAPTPSPADTFCTTCGVCLAGPGRILFPESAPKRPLALRARKASRAPSQNLTVFTALLYSTPISL